MPNFIYNRNIPNGPNNPSRDQPDMQVNTNSIDDLIAIDHYSFESDGNLDGWHKQSTYPSFALVPAAGPTTLTNQGAVYTKDVGGGDIELFYRREANGTEIQITQQNKIFNAPTILTGSVTPTVWPVYTTVTALPTDIYGYILLLDGNGPAIGEFTTQGGTCIASASARANNATGTVDTAVFFQGMALNLQIATKNATILSNYRIHYWSI